MKNWVLLLLVLGFTQTGQSLFAQDLTYIGGTENQLVYNPALAGQSGLHSLKLNYQAWFPSIPGAPVDASFTYDGPLPDCGKFVQGMGVQFVTMRVGEGNIYRSNAMVNYAVGYPVGANGMLRMGVRAGFADGFLNMPTTPIGYFPSGQLPTSSYIPFWSYRGNIGAGLMYHTQHFWIGTAADHLNRPKSEVGEFREPITYRFSAGANITAGQVVFQPNLATTLQDNVLTLRPALNVFYRSIMVKAGYHLITVTQPENYAYDINTAFLGGGWNFRDKFRMYYTFGYSASRLTNGYSGSHHSLGLEVNFGTGKKNSKSVLFNPFVTRTVRTTGIELPEVKSEGKL